MGVAICVALAVLLLGHSGWRRTFRVLAVPLCAYGIWFVLAGRTGLRTTGDHFGASVFLKVPIFVISNMAQESRPGRRLGEAGAGPGCGLGGVGALVRAPSVQTPSRRARRGFGCHCFLRAGGDGAGPDQPDADPLALRLRRRRVLVPALALMFTDLRDLAQGWQRANGRSGPHVARPGGQWPWCP